MCRLTVASGFVGSLEWVWFVNFNYQSGGRGRDGRGICSEYTEYNSIK